MSREHINPTKIRRLLACGVTMTVLACGTQLRAQNPVMRNPIIASSKPSSGMDLSAKRRVLSSVMPIASRTVRLKPIVAELPRAVVTAIAADPRGQLLAVSGDDHAIRIVDMSTLNVLETLQAHRDLIRTLAFSPDGSKLVSAGNDGQVIVWSRDREFAIAQKMQSSLAFACVTFAPDGKQMAAVGFDNTVYMIGHVASEQPTFKCDCTDLRTVAYRKDSKLLAVAGRTGTLHLFNPVTGELLLEKTLHNGRIYDVEFYNDGSLMVSVGGDGMAVVFDTRSLEVVREIRVSTGKLFAVSVLDDKHIAVAGSDNIVRVVDVIEGTTVRRLEGHQGSVPTLAFSNGKLFSGGFDATLRRWSVDQVTGKPARIADGGHQLDR